MDNIDTLAALAQGNADLWNCKPLEIDAGDPVSVSLYKKYLSTRTLLCIVRFSGCCPLSDSTLITQHFEEWICPRLNVW